MKTQEARGKVKQAKGRIEQAVGVVTGDRALEQKGALERAEGAVQEGLAKAGRKLGEAADDLAKAIKR